MVKLRDLVLYCHDTTSNYAKYGASKKVIQLFKNGQAYRDRNYYDFNDELSENGFEIIPEVGVKFNNISEVDKISALRIEDVVNRFDKNKLKSEYNFHTITDGVYEYNIIAIAGIIRDNIGKLSNWEMKEMTVRSFCKEKILPELKYYIPNKELLLDSLTEYFYDNKEKFLKY